MPPKKNNKTKNGDPARFTKDHTGVQDNSTSFGIENENRLSAHSSIPDNTNSADFLLAEYERLRELRTEVGQRAFRRFEFYLTIISAASGGYLLISQSKKEFTTPQYIVDLALLGFLVYGVITFVNLVYASAFNLDVIRATKAIQRYFVDHDPEIEKNLYFNIYVDRSRSYGFRRILSRGVGGGSEKVVITLIDGILIAYLLLSLFQNYLVLQLSNISVAVIVMIIFIISGFLHAIYVTFMYKYY